MTNQEPTPDRTPGNPEALAQAQFDRAQVIYGSLDSLVSQGEEVSPYLQQVMATVAMRLADDVEGGPDKQDAHERDVFLDVWALAEDQPEAEAVVEALMAYRGMGEPTAEELPIIAEKRQRNAEVAVQIEGIRGETRGLLERIPGLQLTGDAVQFLDTIVAECHGVRHSGLSAEDRGQRINQLLARYQAMIAETGLPPSLYGVAETLLKTQ